MANGKKWNSSVGMINERRERRDWNSRGVNEY